MTTAVTALTTVLLHVAMAPVSGQVPPRPHWLGFRFDLGLEFPRGDAGDLFQGSTRGEFSILIAPASLDPWYLAFGVGLVSYTPGPQLDEEEVWNHFTSFAGFAWSGRRALPLPLYLEGRLVYRRVRPLDRRYWERLQGDNPPEEVPFDQWHGLGAEAVAGIELSPSSRVSFDVSVRVGVLSPDRVVQGNGWPLAVGGWMFGLQTGLLWYP